ncbi:MAG: HNH endonuclease [Candidatus Promineifilaceae bacterium]
MGISLKTHKILWGRSGNRCAICQNKLIVDSDDPNDDPSIVGDEAHIIARKPTFTRGDYESLTPEERDHYSNLILLCKVHHKQIDDQPAYYTVERLREIKALHEDEVAAEQSEEIEKKQRDDIIYAGYVDRWAQLADLDDWQNISSWLSADTPTFPKRWYENQKRFLNWIIGRIWPRRYPALESAFLNYKAILQDLLKVFDSHSAGESYNRGYLRTEKFYKIREFDEEKYHRLLNEYEAHVSLVNDLFFELTRAANYICDRVRDTIFDGYRLVEGAVLIERYNVGYALETVIARPEYHGDERTECPYPGLRDFKEIRYTTRDYALDPIPPQLLDLDHDDA